MKLKNLL